MYKPLMLGSLLSEPWLKIMELEAVQEHSRKLIARLRIIPATTALLLPILCEASTCDDQKLKADFRVTILYNYHRNTYLIL